MIGSVMPRKYPGSSIVHTNAALSSYALFTLIVIWIRMLLGANLGYNHHRVCSLHNKPTTVGWTICGCVSVESCGMLTLKSAVKAFQELRILDSYRGGDLIMLSLTEHFGVRDRLHKYIEILKVARS